VTPGADLRVDVLGPLMVHVGGAQITPPTGKQAVVLAGLAIFAGQPVSTEMLAEKAWGDRLPEHARRSLHTLVSRLRSTVAGSRIVWMPSGYCLDIEPENVDLLRFRRLVADAAMVPEEQQARRLLKEALGLWRGEPLAGLRSEAFVRDDCPRLLEERLAVLRQRINRDLAAGLHEQLIPELRDLTERYPTHEWLWHFRMLALHRSGRTAEALDCYTTARAVFVRELGIEPGATLIDLQRAILRADPGLSLAEQRSLTAAGDSRPLEFGYRATSQIPVDLGDFTGRQKELARLTQGAGSDGAAVRIATITGMPGVGKTALAVRAAHACASRYPDGQIFIDLNGHGHSPADAVMTSFDALGSLLRTVGAAEKQLPSSLAERASLWRACLAGRKIVLLIDDAVDAAQVRPLLPGAADCLVLITSRHRLADLEPVTDCLSLDVFGPRECLCFLTRVAGAGRGTPESALELSRLCGGLPLALRIAGQRLGARPTWSMTDLIRRLRDESQRLEELAIGNRSVAGALDASCELLNPLLWHLFQTLGLMSQARFGVADVSAAAGLSTDEAERGLEELVDVHLLRLSPEPGYYVFHELVRVYARKRAASAQDAEAAPPLRSLRLLNTPRAVQSPPPVMPSLGSACH
jgi:DNA-binding SARP family transcriptional activator